MCLVLFYRYAQIKFDLAYIAIQYFVSFTISYYHVNGVLMV